MAKTLEQLLNSKEAIELAMRVYESPVHWLEAVPGEPTKVRTACRKFQWVAIRKLNLDPNRIVRQSYTVTCLECLEAMADTPIVMEM